ncbi:MAG: rRNA maturation RNase YbeY [Elusimicrobia bacterium]|nr:rRNA maturation RNase YbeY [Elusimicrobiota bacterium]
MTIRVFGAALLPPAARRPRTISAVCRRVLVLEKVRSGGELSVVFLDRRRMRALNRRFLGRTHDTDVIAFCYAEDAGPLKGEKPFGDVFISAYQARLQAADQGHDVLTEVLFLAAHGTLHLLGYDDDTARRRAAMFRKQRLVLPGRRP